MAQTITTVTGSTTEEYSRNLAAALGMSVASVAGAYTYCSHNVYDEFNFRISKANNAGVAYLQLQTSATQWLNVMNCGGAITTAYPNGETHIESIENAGDYFYQRLDDAYFGQPSDTIMFFTAYDCKTDTATDRIFTKNIASSVQSNPAYNADGVMNKNGWATGVSNYSNQRVYALNAGECLKYPALLNTSVVKSMFGFYAESNLIANLVNNAYFLLKLDDNSTYRKIGNYQFMRVD